MKSLVSLSVAKWSVMFVYWVFGEVGSSLTAGWTCVPAHYCDGRVSRDEWSVKNNNWFSLFTLRYQRERTTMADVKWGHPQPSYITHIISLSLSPHQSPGPVKLSYESLMMWVWWWWPGTDQKLHNGQESHDPPNLRFLDCRMGSIMEGPIKRGNTSDHCTYSSLHTSERLSVFACFVLWVEWFAVQTLSWLRWAESVGWW